MVIRRRRGLVSMVAPTVPFTITRRAWKGGREEGEQGGREGLLDKQRSDERKGCE